MRLSSDTYMDAAREHLSAARRLYEAGDYVLTHYVSGLAVECLFFAFKFNADSTATLDEKHDLLDLGRNSGFFDLVPERFKELNSTLMAVSLRWRNSHRYRSLKSLKKFIVDAALHQRIKGDVVKENSRIILSSALFLLMHGANQWPRSKQ